MELIKSPETKIKSGNPKNKKIEKKRKKKGKMEIERYLLLPRSYYPFSFSTIFFISIEDGKKRGSAKTRKLFKERGERGGGGWLTFRLRPRTKSKNPLERAVKGQNKHFPNG